MAEYGERPFGLNEIKIVSADGLTVVTLEASRTLQFTPRMLTGELTGSDALQAVASFIEAAEWEMEEGGIPLAAFAIMFGFAANETGVTPNRVKTMVIDTATALPYFKIYGKLLDENTGDVHVKMTKAKITGNVTWEAAYGEFVMSGLSGIAVKDGANGAIQIVQNETITALPTS